MLTTLRHEPLILNQHYSQHLQRKQTHMLHHYVNTAYFGKFSRDSHYYSLYLTKTNANSYQRQQQLFNQRSLFFSNRSGNSTHTLARRMRKTLKHYVLPFQPSQSTYENLGSIDLN